MDIHGVAKSPYWTFIENSVSAGDTTLTLSEATDWVVGDVLAIAPSSFNNKEKEKVTITAISGTSVTFEPALKYDHYSAIESYGGEVFFFF